MKIIIPMAGEGTRVKSSVPKPLVEVIDGKPMIQLALESLDLDGHYCFITRRYANPDWNGLLREAINKVITNPVIVEIDYLTKGPAISALHAPYTFFDDESLLITNCDQIMHWDSQKFVDFVETTDANGVVVTYKSNTPKNSYAKILEGETGDYSKFTYVREKEVISQYSLNGIHWWKHGRDFPYTVQWMMDTNDTTNGEYYIGPSFTYLKDHKRIYNIDKSQHWAVGTAEDIQIYREKFGNGNKAN